LGKGAKDLEWWWYQEALLEQNAQNIGLVDTVFEELISDESFIETCNFLRSHTLRQTTQLAKYTIHYPMRRHLKSSFQMLRNKRLNEVIATDTYFANEKSIEGYHCA
jgi:hypothetical protein